MTQKSVTTSKFGSTKKEAMFQEPGSREDGLVLPAETLRNAAAVSIFREMKFQQLEWWKRSRHFLGPQEEERNKRGRK